MSKKIFTMMLGLTVALGSFQVAFAVDNVSGASQSTTTSKPSTNKPSTSKPSTSKPSTSKPSTTKPVTTPSTDLSKPGEVYTIQWGDTLAIIANRYGLTYQEIATYNNITNPHKIYQGQKIVIPTKTAEAKPEVQPEVKPEVKPEVEQEVDVVTSASFPKTEAQFHTSLSENGAWISCLEEDLTTTKEIVVAGEFKNKEVVARKLALYTQDADRNVTASFTLTAPKLTVKSENFKIQEGTFVGDIYVDAPGFSLVNTQVKGNVYFTKEAYRKSFKLEKEAKVSGAVATAAALDAVASASVSTDETSLNGAFEGSWIATVLNDITAEKELVIDGRFERQNKTTLALEPTRKLALYDQDADKKVTASHTLTAPKLTVKSAGTKIQEGTFVGDIYVNAPGFNLVRTTVDGNIYFAKEAYKRTANLSLGTVTGKVAVEAADLDAVTSASFPTEAAAVETALSEKGAWIICLTDDLAVEKEIVVEGTFHSKNDPEAAIARKLALYAQDGGKNVTEEYVLTVPKMTVRSENFKIQQGTVVGDILVEADGFNLVNTVVEGNITFAKEAYKESFKMDGTSKVTGTIK